MSAKETYERLKDKDAFGYHISTGKNLTKREANEVGFTEEQRASFNAALAYGRKQGGEGSLSEDLQDGLSKRGFGSKKTQEGDSKVVTVKDKKPKFKKGGKVRGVGKAKKGVRKCKMR
tara:strand:+ start:11570 stop:11923 length:354 start_codon:yes stop_codon:yes gene_type:complete